VSVELATKAEPKAQVVRLLDILERCDVFHDGLVVDLPSRNASARRSFGETPPEVVSSRGGAEFVALNEATTSYRFWLDEPVQDLRVRLRYFPGRARVLTVAVDEATVGSLRLEGDQPQTRELRLTGAKLAPGVHQVRLRAWRPDPNRAGQPHLELDWLTVGSAEREPTDSYDAPSRDTMVVDRELGGVPRTSVVLAAPARLACPLRVGHGTSLHALVGLWGQGKGTAEIRVTPLDGPSQVLQRHRLNGGPDTQWLPVSADLSPFAGQLVTLELVASQASRNVRVLFAEPRLESPPEPLQTVGRAKNVIILVASGLERRHLPPWGSAGDLPALAELARRSVAFSQYRVPTSVPAGNVASLLSGLHPRQHKLQDVSARLPEAAPLLPRAARHTGVRAAMFTGVPTTFAAFGFNAGWQHFEQLSPVADLAAAEPLRRGAAWLKSQMREAPDQRRLLVVHLRGGHPPWDLRRDDVASLPPKEYGGPLDARRGGIVLGQLRAQKRPQNRHLSEEDWVRFDALRAAAMVDQSRALGEFMDMLNQADVWNETLVVLVGDVGEIDRPALPFDPTGTLSEAELMAPLLVRLPGSRFAALEVSTPVTAMDVAATVYAALGVEPPVGASGRDLASIADGLESPLERAQVATLVDRYATRLGPYLLTGNLGRVPNLCRTDIDPACHLDVTSQQPRADWAMWWETFDTLMPKPSEVGAPSLQREPATLDPETLNALVVWGDVPEAAPSP